MEKIELALEELKLLQDIIARHDDISLKIKGWSITLNIGILAAVYGIGGGNRLEMTKFSLYVCLLMVTGFFVWLEAIYRVAMYRAIDRGTTIEKEIRDNNLGHYPMINHSLGKPNRTKDQLKAVSNVRTIAPYILIIFIDTLALFILS